MFAIFIVIRISSTLYNLRGVPLFKTLNYIPNAFKQEDEEPLEPDELPEHLRPQPQIDMSQMNLNDPESLLKTTKKGRSLMTFVKVSGNPTRAEAEDITKLWQTSLWNSQIQAERYITLFN